MTYAQQYLPLIRNISVGFLSSEIIILQIYKSKISYDNFSKMKLWNYKQRTARQLVSRQCVCDVTFLEPRDRKPPWKFRGIKLFCIT